MDEVLTWPIVKAQVDQMARGAGYQLAQHLGMNASYFYRKLKTGGDLTERQARLVREFMASKGGEPAPAATLPPPRQSRRRLDLYGFAAASEGELIAMNDGNVIDQIELPMGLELGPGDYFAVRPIGSSMEPRIFAGELLVVRRRYPPAHGKDVVVEFHDGSAVIKTYKGERQGRVWVEQFNPPKGLDYDAAAVKALHAVAFKL